ncbi:MAG: type II secretion system F family protein [Phycisphaerales bacterium]|nr:type II secretion system F family protein [Phycisphaerales bacterium]
MSPLLAELNLVQLALPLVGSVLLSYGIYQVIVETRKGERKKVLDRLRGETARAKKVEAISILKRDHLADDAGAMIQRTFGKLTFIPRLQTMLDQADLAWSAPKMLANLFAAGMIFAAGLIMLDFSVLAGVGAFVSIMLLPVMYVSFRRKRRMKKLVHQLPDVFEMMSQALRAGHSLASAIHLIQEQMPDPISSEFGRVFHEQNLGLKVEDALLAMADRVDSLDVRMFVTAVLIQRTTGGDLAEILDKIGGVIRGRIELFGQVQSLTSEGRLSGWVLFALPIIVFGATVKLNYSYASMLWTHPTGKILLAVAIGMQLMGLAMIRWIVNIKV